MRRLLVAGFVAGYVGARVVTVAQLHHQRAATARAVMAAMDAMRSVPLTPAAGGLYEGSPDTW